MDQPDEPRAGEPVGVILAGGRGRRMGAPKALVELAGRPLISYPLAALQAALHEVVVLAKEDTLLPTLAGASLWLEPPEPHHPLAGIFHALDRAAGRAVLVCAVDLPFVTAELVSRIARVDPHGAAATLAAHEGQIQPLLGCYGPSARSLLGGPGDTVSMREAVARLRPALVEVEDPDQLFNVNTPQDLRRAAVIASRT